MGGVQVDAEQPVAVGVCEPADHKQRAPVAALCSEARICEHVGHQPREKIGHLDDAKTRLAGLERERVTGKRRRDDRERVRRVTPKPGRIGEPWDELVELPHRPRPAMDQEERQRVRADAALMDEVEVDPLERHRN